MTSSERRPRIVGFTGSTRRPSKSRALAEAIIDRARSRIDADTEIFDVVDAGRGLGSAYLRSELPPEALRIVEAIEQADALVAVTPTYKGSYTGLFKHLFDFVDQKALLHKPVVVAATGAGHRHALIVEHQLRPLFGFFSAAVVSTAVYAADQEFVDGKPADAALIHQVEQAGDQLALLLKAR